MKEITKEINGVKVTCTDVHSGCITLKAKFNEYEVEAACRFDDCNHLRFKDKYDGEMKYLHIDGLYEFIEFLQTIAEARSEPEFDSKGEFFVD